MLTEWLSTNLTGSFAMGTPDRLPERKYHGALIVRRPGSAPPLHVLADVAETLVLPGPRFELAQYRYRDTIHPAGGDWLVAFHETPNPTWAYDCDGVQVTRELELVPDRDEVRLHYRVHGAPTGTELHLSPLFTMRDVHALTHENPYLDGTASPMGRGAWRFELYAGVPAVDLSIEPVSPLCAGGHWNRRVEYAEEARRGYDAREDLYSPGYVRLAVDRDDYRATLSVRVPTRTTVTEAIPPAGDADEREITVDLGETLIDRLRTAADRFIYFEPSTRQPGLIAGYPWFGDWSRDTLISLPGILLARGRTELAQRLLSRVSSLRVDGLVPRLLGANSQDSAEPCADGTLWFIRAVEQLESVAGEASTRRLAYAVIEMLEAFESHCVPGAAIGGDGLLYVDRRPLASTWMDAEVDGHAVTPRAPLAVEIQALFLHAVRYATRLAERLGRPGLVGRWQALAERQRRSFRERFWNASAGYLNDAHDGHRADESLRPNQLVALALDSRDALTPAEQRSALEKVQRSLWTPVGLRTLAPEDPRYRGTCVGTQRERDLAYHQGTVWPWLFGPYLDAVAAIDGPEATSWELVRCLRGIETHLDEAGLGQVSEIFDGNAPHTPRGAPAQAWSVAELLRVALMYGTSPPDAPPSRSTRAPESLRCES